MMKKILIKTKAMLAMAGFWISLKLRLYGLWGMLVRAVGDHKYHKDVLTVMSPEEYDDIIKFATWKEDRIWKLPIDNVRSARRFHSLLEYTRIRSIELTGSRTVVDPVAEAKLEWPDNNTDCDDYSQYGASVIDPLYAPLYLAVGSINYETGKMSGHAVVLTISGFDDFGNPNGLKIRGNWGMIPHVGEFRDLNEAALHISNGMGGEPFTWALWKINRPWPEWASLIDFGFGEAPEDWDPDRLIQVYNLK
jgi:hypothetical protein